MNRFGPWWLDQLVAVGGIGEVWRARADEATNSPAVALKRMHTHLARNDDARALFAQEGHLACTLPRHVNVVHGLANGEVDELPYIALALAPGVDLRRIIAPPPTRERAIVGSVTLSRPHAIAIVAAACDAAAHLHGLGWVHGDINPGNLVVELAPSLDDQVTLVDLGVVRKIGEGGAVRGTHAYMAPEQVKGEAWTAATDVFALGVVLWELIRGERLFHRGPTWLSMAAVVEATPAKLDDPALDKLVRATLAKDPAQRMQSAAELAVRLRALAS